MPLIPKDSEFSRKIQHSLNRLFLLLAGIYLIIAILIFSLDSTFHITNLHESPFLWLSISFFSAMLGANYYLRRRLEKLYENELLNPLYQIQSQLRSIEEESELTSKLDIDEQSPFAELSAEINALLEQTRLQQREQLDSQEKFKNLYYALQESDSYFRAIFQQTNEGIILLKDNGSHFYEFNQSALDILGYKRRELSTLTLPDIIIDCRDANGSLLLTDKTLPERFTATFITYQGNHLECHVSATEIEVDDLRHRMIMFHDVSQQRLAERTMQALNSQLQAVLDASRHIAIIMVDNHGVVQLFNRGAEAILKYPRNKAIGKLSITDIIEQPQTLEKQVYSDSQQFNELIHHLTENNIVLSQCQYQDKYGGLVPVEQTFTQIIDSQGKDHGYLFIAWDLRQKLSEEKRQQELESQLQQSQKMETIGTLAGGIAHDLNNLLTPVLGYTELLLEDSKDNPSHQQRLQRILSASLRAKELVKQILTFSHQIDHDAQPTEVKEIVKEVLELLFASLPANIKLNVDIIDPDARIFADLTKIHQVLMNLCTNAAHAIGNQDGQITITIDSEELDEETSNIILPSGRYVKLSVRDTGCGISKAALNRIFEPFFTTKDVGEGTGLGLSVVHGIIRAHDGVIRVKSKPKKGTTFDIYLPYYDDRTSDVSTTSEILLGNGKRIMLVDDERPVLNLSEEILKRRGYVVDAFDDSKAALQAFKLAPKSFDIVLTDESMPDLVGTQLAREIHAIKPEIPIILLTGLGQILSTKEQAELGITQVISKPVLSNDLVKIIYEATSEVSSEATTD